MDLVDERATESRAMGPEQIDPGDELILLLLDPATNTNRRTRR